MTAAIVICASASAPQQAQGAPAAAAERQAFELAQEALQLYRDRQFEAAAALYRRAYELQPKTVEYLFGAARSELAAGLTEQAQRHFAAVCAAVGQDHALCQRAERHLAEAAQRPPPSVPQAEPARLPAAATAVAAPDQPLALQQLPAAVLESPPSVVGRPLARSQRLGPRWWGWAAAGVAGAGAVVGAGLAVGANAQQGELDSKRLADGRFDLGRVSYQEARSAQQSINNLWWGAGAAAIFAAVGAGAAVYLLQLDPAPGSGRPDPW